MSGIVALMHAITTEIQLAINSYQQLCIIFNQYELINFALGNLVLKHFSYLLGYG